MYRLEIYAEKNREDGVNTYPVYLEVNPSKDELMKVISKYLSDEDTISKQAKLYNPDYYRFELYEEHSNVEVLVLSYIDFP